MTIKQTRYITLHYTTLYYTGVIYSGLSARLLNHYYNMAYRTGK